MKDVVFTSKYILHKKEASLYIHIIVITVQHIHSNKSITNQKRTQLIRKHTVAILNALHNNMILSLSVTTDRRNLLCNNNVPLVETSALTTQAKKIWTNLNFSKSG